MSDSQRNSGKTAESCGNAWLRSRVAVLTFFRWDGLVDLRLLPHHGGAGVRLHRNADRHRGQLSGSKSSIFCYAIWTEVNFVQVDAVRAAKLCLKSTKSDSSDSVVSEKILESMIATAIQHFYFINSLKFFPDT